MTVLYHLRDVVKRYGERTVLRVPELQIQEAETLALIGPSGAGKSTLLRLLGLLEPPSHGIISYADLPVNGSIPQELRREIILMFQRPLLLDTSVQRNVAFGLQIRGIRDDRRVSEALELVGLGGMENARARTLSGGERQRVSLARALIVRPMVLLLDEPTAHLDPHNVAVIERSITALHQEHGTTIVIATHNLHQARRLAARTAMLLDGDVIEASQTACVLDHPADERTRAFVHGDMVY
jgi:tungstate transport system ATP-binding protein